MAHQGGGAWRGRFNPRPMRNFGEGRRPQAPTSSGGGESLQGIGGGALGDQAQAMAARGGTKQQYRPVQHKEPAKETEKGDTPVPQPAQPLQSNPRAAADQCLLKQGCAKQRREASTAATPTLCYKCGEEGHFARGCTKNTKSDRMNGESSAYSRKKGKGKKDFGTRSAPHDARKTSKRKSPLFEERRNSSHFKSKARGGWIADDADDQPYKKCKPNVWASPSTPKKQYNNRQFSSGGDYSTPQSSRWQKHGFASPSATYSPNTRKHSFSSSRFASNTHVRFGRS
ncbi:hypothetical protein OsI_36561 [Oryza sativa Indica Group]|uniref:CCHC-type domain-containing protein n=1 Tax=Oryza sativa subsp. indica TaxID=39946 RepID=B8BL64_ORYSI|nr:hypothetical protein OsI_36561 [Oryza sativa Indica Group]